MNASELQNFKAGLDRWARDEKVHSSPKDVDPVVAGLLLVAQGDEMLWIFLRGC